MVDFWCQGGTFSSFLTCGAADISQSLCIPFHKYFHKTCLVATPQQPRISTSLCLLTSNFSAYSFHFLPADPRRKTLRVLATPLWCNRTLWRLSEDHVSCDATFQKACKAQSKGSLTQNMDQWKVDEIWYCISDQHPIVQASFDSAQHAMQTSKSHGLRKLPPNWERNLRTMALGTKHA